MKRLLLVLIMAGTAFGGKTNPGDPAEDAPIEVYEPTYQTPEQHALFLEAVETAKTAPGLAGTSVGVRVNLEWALIDRRAEKKNPPPATPGTLETLAKLAGRSTSATGSVTIVYTRVTGYDDSGKPLYETMTFSAGAAVGDAAVAQASMNEAMSKSHK